MAKKPTKSETDKRLETLAVETEKNKRAVVAQLRRTPTVQSACQATGVGRSTYYKWRADDFVFASAADSALAGGKFLVNDMAEAQIMRMIREGNVTACIFWLKYNHPAYTKKHVHEYDIVCTRESVEERHSDSEDYSWSAVIDHRRKLSPDALRVELLAEDREDEAMEETERRMKAFREESDGS